MLLDVQRFYIHKEILTGPYQYGTICMYENIGEQAMSSILVITLNNLSDEKAQT